MQKKNSRNSMLLFFLGLFLISSLMLGKLLLPFLPIMVLGALMASVFKPLHHFLEKRIRVVPASVITCVLIFFVLCVPIVLLVGVLSKEAADMYHVARSTALKDRIRAFIENSELVEQANDVLSTFNFRLTGEQLNQAIAEIGKIVGLFLYEQASAIASNVFGFVISFLLMLIVIYFLLIDGDKLISFIKDLSPLPPEQDDKLIEKFKDMAFAILIVNGLSGLIQGVLSGTVFMLFGFRSSVLWGVIAGLSAFLPVIGIPAVFIPAAIYLMVIGRVGAGVFFLIFCVITSFTIDNILKPKLVGYRVSIHPLLVFLSIIGGLKLFGILGIIYGPLIVTGFLTLTDIYHASYQNMVE